MKKNTSPQPYPWYDDRVTVLPEEEKPEPEWPYNTLDTQASYDTPQAIYTYLSQHVWKQETAKRAASVLAYNCFERSVKSNIMFVGPTGCGKTHIWRCLKNIFPDRIEIVDGSNITADGWKGDKKWASLFHSPIFHSGKRAILVIDEADKMFAPRYSGGENVSQSIQSEGLAMLEGTNIEVKEGPSTYRINTSKISFVLCGAFSAKAEDVAQKESGSRIGFSAAPVETKAYDRHLTQADLMAFGVMPEFMGRIQHIVHLEPMTADDYYRITGDSVQFLQRLKKQYRANIKLSPEIRHKLAEEACSSGLGIRGMENRIRAMLDEAIFDNHNKRCYEF